MAPLLSLSQQQDIKIISENWANTSKAAGGTTNYIQLAEEVEEKELRDLLGVALLQDLQDNPTSTNNVKLLDGDSFEDCNGNTIKHKGIRYMLAYLNFARYIWESDISDTFTGFASKNREESSDLQDGRKKRLELTQRQIALGEWELISDYLDEKSDDFPLWECGIDSKKPYTPKLYGVRNTKKKVYYDKKTRKFINNAKGII